MHCPVLLEPHFVPCRITLVDRIVSTVFPIIPMNWRPQKTTLPSLPIPCSWLLSPTCPYYLLRIPWFLCNRPRLTGIQFLLLTRGILCSRISSNQRQSHRRGRLTVLTSLSPDMWSADHVQHVERRPGWNGCLRRYQWSPKCCPKMRCLNFNLHQAEVQDLVWPQYCATQDCRTEQCHVLQTPPSKPTTIKTTKTHQKQFFSKSPALYAKRQLVAATFSWYTW